VLLHLILINIFYSIFVDGTDGSVDTDGSFCSGNLSVGGSVGSISSNISLGKYFF
jgi:hypothetical protein